MGFSGKTYRSKTDIVKSKLMKLIIFIAAVEVFMVVFGAYGVIMSRYQWELKAGSNWELADRSSTLEAKSQYVDSFIKSLEIMEENRDLAKHNAIILKTPQNETKNNIGALKTLQKRLEEVKAMDTKSFEYNQAIQQITSQEQGEADRLIRDIRGAFILSNYWYIWSWIGETVLFLSIFLPFILVLVIAYRSTAI